MLTLFVGGQRFEGWTSVNVSRAVDKAVSTFDIALTEKWSGRSLPWVITPGEPCRVQLDGDDVITGYVDSYNPSYSASDHTVRVTGRSRTADVADCSAIWLGGQFNGYDVGRIAKTLAAKVGVDVTIETDVGAPFPDVQIQQGETIFELIERLCRLRAILVSDGPGGDIVLTRAGRGRAPDSLREGVNILQASATLSVGERYSDYIVKGQQASTDQVFGVAATEVVATERDPGVKRYRPKLVVAEGQSDTATAASRAKWENLTRAANGVRAEITVQGWRGRSGGLWLSNQTVEVVSSSLNLSRSLLIAGVTYRLDAGGTTCDLSVAPPEAFTPEPVDEAAAAAKGNPWGILDGTGVLSPPIGRKEGAGR